MVAPSGAMNRALSAWATSKKWTLSVPVASGVAMLPEAGSEGSAGEEGSGGSQAACGEQPQQEQAAKKAAQQGNGSVFHRCTP